MRQYPLVSVVILTRNRCVSLERTLGAVVDQAYPRLEVIVVDNGSIDRTSEVVKKFGVRYIFSKPDEGFAVSRQRGVDAAKGEIIAMCDDDCVPRNDWLRQLVNRLCSNEIIGLVGGRVINIGFPENKRFKGRGRIGKNGVLAFVEDPQQADYFGSANMAFKRCAFEMVGGYDPFFQGGLEEADLALNMRKFGFRVEYEPNAVVEHFYTGISFKGNHTFQGYSQDAARLYLYLKYFQPTSPWGWCSFLAYEAWLLGKALWRTLRNGMRQIQREIAARMAIPRLLQLACQKAPEKYF